MCHLDYVFFINLGIKAVYNLVTDCVTLIPGIMELRKCWNWRSSDLEPGQMPKMSSWNREYRSGWIWKEFMAAWSNYFLSFIVEIVRKTTNLGI